MELYSISNGYVNLRNEMVKNGSSLGLHCFVKVKKKTHFINPNHCGVGGLLGAVIDRHLDEIEVLLVGHLVDN